MSFCDSRSSYCAFRSIVSLGRRHRDRSEAARGRRCVDQASLINERHCSGSCLFLAKTKESNACGLLCAVRSVRRPKSCGKRVPCVFHSSGTVHRRPRLQHDRTGGSPGDDPEVARAVASLRALGRAITPPPSVPMIQSQSLFGARAP